MAGRQGPSAEEKLVALIEKTVSAAFEQRDRASKEKDDPWARIEGIVDRAVSKHFEALAEGVEEGKKRERGGGRQRDDEGDDEGEDRPKLGILGL